MSSTRPLRALKIKRAPFDLLAQVIHRRCASPCQDGNALGRRHESEGRVFSAGKVALAALQSCLGGFRTLKEIKFYSAFAVICLSS